eukprot:m.170925 g.170925  ORF g.170925 m.170925 type:complete len:112 (+) comp21242_c4_seq1:147-482(+)
MQAKGQEIILWCMRAAARDSTTQDYGTSVLEYLATGSTPEAQPQEVADLRAAGAIQVVQHVLAVHPTDYNVHANGRRVLALLEEARLGATVQWLRAMYNELGRWAFPAKPQ